jgi:bacterioferritin-associated ferredoxin
LYTCICERVRECEVRAVIRRGACTEEAVGSACGAGTGCGTCLDRIGELIDEEQPVRVMVAGVALAA